MTTNRHVPGAIKIRCNACRWRGDRLTRPMVPRWGTCPKCGAVLVLAATLAERRMAKAKAELEQLES